MELLEPEAALKSNPGRVFGGSATSINSERSGGKKLVPRALRLSFTANGNSRCLRAKLPENLRKPSVKFSQLLDDALAYSKRNKRPCKTDVPRFASLDEWFGSHPAEELAPKEIENILARAADKKKWAPSTLNHYRSLMSLSYRLGILNRKVTCNPARSVTHRREDNNRVRFLTEEEGKKLRKVIEARWPLHVPELNFAINTGLRKGSQYSLTWDMVDFRGRMLNVPRTKNEEPIHVPLNDAAVAALRVVHSRGEGKGRVFQSAKTGEPLENGRHWFDDAVAKRRSKTFVGTTCDIHLRAVCE